MSLNKSRGSGRGLVVENLESRQLLHGGAMMGPPEPPTIEEHVTATFERFDTNEDGVLLVAEEGGDQIPHRLWERISQADVPDSEAGVTRAEFTAHLEDHAEELEGRREKRQEQREERREKRQEQREERREERQQRRASIAVTAMVERIFADRDVVDPETGEADGLLSEDELGRHWGRLAEAAGEDGFLSADELTDWINSRIADRAHAEEANSPESPETNESPEVPGDTQEVDAETTGETVAGKNRTGGPPRPAMFVARASARRR